MKKVTLSLQSRLMVSGALMQEPGNMQEAIRLYKVAEKLELTDGEREQIEWKTLEGGGVQYNIDKAMRSVATFNFEDADWDTLLATVNKQENWLPSKGLVRLSDQLAKVVEIKYNAKEDKTEAS